MPSIVGGNGSLRLASSGLALGRRSRIPRRIGYDGGMKPSFNFLDLLPFQLLGGLGFVFAALGLKAGGLWLFIGLPIAAPPVGCRDPICADALIRLTRYPHAFPLHQPRLALDDRGRGVGPAAASGITRSKMQQSPAPSATIHVMKLQFSLASILACIAVMAVVLSYCINIPIIEPASYSDPIYGGA